MGERAPGFRPADGDEAATLDVAPSDAGTTREDHLSERAWKVVCGGCDRLVPAAERERCGDCVTDGALLGETARGGER